MDDDTAGTWLGTVTVDGVERGYRFYVPDNIRVPATLVVMLHGGFGSAEQAQEAYGWDDEADRGGFAVVYPDGDGRAWSVGGGCCGQSGRSGTDDVAVVEAVVDAVGRQVPVDPARVYATGMSNGAMMAYRLACESDRFAAIAPVAGTLMGSCVGPAPVSVLHIHGLADTNVRFDGNPGDGFAAIDGEPVGATVDRWRRVGGCEPPAWSTDGAVTRSSAACPDGRAVDLITIEDAGHEWPLDATATIWQFFAAHPRPMITPR